MKAQQLTGDACVNKVAFTMTLREKLDLLKDLLVPGRITDAEYDLARMSVLESETTAEVLARFSRPPGESGERKKQD